MAQKLNKPEVQGSNAHAAVVPLSRPPLDATSSRENKEPVKQEALLDTQIAWEQGQLSEADTIALFQKLVDSDVVWKLNGPVRRTAASLIRDGRIHR